MGDRQMQYKLDTYVAMGAEPHSVAISKSWIERSVQLSIITRKCMSQRLSVSCERQQSVSLQLFWILAWQITAELTELTSVSRIKRRFSTTTIFLTPLKLRQDAIRKHTKQSTIWILINVSKCLWHLNSSVNHIHKYKTFIFTRFVPLRSTTSYKKQLAKNGSA